MALHVEVPELAGTLDLEDAGTTPARLDRPPLDQLLLAHHPQHALAVNRDTKLASDEAADHSVAVGWVALRRLHDRQVDRIGHRTPLRRPPRLRSSIDGLLAYGTVYALAARTGKVIWSFSTVRGGGKLWGNPKENGGGGLWYPPAVDSHGRVFIGVANPAPYPNSPSDPNAQSRPGPNLYTDSLVALNGDTGKLLWYQQVTPHDLRDYDFQDPPIVTTQSIGGTKTEIVIGAGKSGKVVAFRADNGKRLWVLNIGEHNKYQYGPLPPKPVVYCPGSLGGVLTPMAQSGDVLYVPWIDLCLKASATTPPAAPSPVSETGGLAAVNAATGTIIWKRTFKSLDAGAATVANNVVFTSTFNGMIYALSTKNGSVLWSTKAPAGINSFPAITKTMLIIGAGAPTKGVSKPNGEIIAYSIGTK